MIPPNQEDVEWKTILEAQLAEQRKQSPVGYQLWIWLMAPVLFGLSWRIWSDVTFSRRIIWPCHRVFAWNEPHLQ